MPDFFLREAKSEDFEFYYKLKSEDSAIYWSGFESAPNRENLFKFWEKFVNLGSLERKILILTNGFESIGYVQAVFDGSSIGLSMGICENKRGYGFGKHIIGTAMDYFSEYTDFFCYVREDNISSMKSFTSNGFHETSKFYYCFFPLDNKEYIMKRLEFHR
ncbi:hypothetical protein [Butyrivibrio sp. XPD2002]|uniref:hypothetical protein n=1 Tax=Butyrivibrio sp. XPD2002 TaxID=1280665 RepID=UPI000479998E|nr:hypothetical protein [Butyrivibrio sp. XPD2002]